MATKTKLDEETVEAEEHDDGELVDEKLGGEKSGGASFINIGSDSGACRLERAIAELSAGKKPRG